MQMFGIGPRRSGANESSPQNAPGHSVRASRTRAVLVFAMHQFMAVIGVAIGAAFLTFDSFALLRHLNPHLFTIHSASRVLTGLHYFPMQILLGLWSGWWFGRHTWRRSLVWVWVLPFLVLCFAVIAVPTLTPDDVSASILNRGNPFSHYFGSGCLAQDRCEDQLLITMPFYASMSYSIGPLIARFHPAPASTH